jgi:hypothetical protein
VIAVHHCDAQHVIRGVNVSDPKANNEQTRQQRGGECAQAGSPSLPPKDDWQEQSRPKGHKKEQRAGQPSQATKQTACQRPGQPRPSRAAQCFKHSKRNKRQPERGERFSQQVGFKKKLPQVECMAQGSRGTELDFSAGLPADPKKDACNEQPHQQLQCINPLVRTNPGKKNWVTRRARSIVTDPVIQNRISKVPVTGSIVISCGRIERQQQQPFKDCNYRNQEQPAQP